MAFVSDSCAETNSNLNRSTCPINPSLIFGLWFSPDLNLLIPTEDLDTRSNIDTLISNGELFVLNDIKDIPESTINGVQTATDNYNNTQVTRVSTNFNITLGIGIGECHLRAAQNWSNRQVAVFPVTEDGKVLGQLIDDGDGTFSLKGVPSTIVFQKGLPIKVNATDIVRPTLNWIVDNWTADRTEDVSSYDPLDIEGVIDVTIAASASSTTSVTVTVSEGCNGTAVTGLVQADFLIEDTSGTDQTPDSVTDNGDGTYTFDFTGSPLSAATDYTATFAAATESPSGSNAIYGRPATATTFTTP